MPRHLMVWVASSFLAASLAVALALPAAALAVPPDVREHPDFDARWAALRAVGVVTPDLKIVEVTAGDTPVFRPDWTERAKEAVTLALEAALREHGVEPVRFTPSADEEKAELVEVQALYEQVVSGVIQATYANKFPAKVARFEYGLGDLSRLLERQHLDALVFTYGTGAVSSRSRKTVQVLSAIVGAGYSVAVDRLFIGVVDRQGDLLWFAVRADTRSDLRDKDSAGEFVHEVSHGLPVPHP